MNDLFGEIPQRSLADGTIVLIDDFLRQSEADHYYRLLAQGLAWRQDEITIFGKKVKIPRLQAWYGDENTAYCYSGLLMQPKPWTPELLTLKDMVQECCGSTFNSVLANFYRHGNDKMGYHSDDEPELGSNPVIASLSLGCTRRFVFKHKHTDEKLALDLPSGSLLVMKGQTQQHYKHAIMMRKSLTQGRINLTFRYVHDNLRALAAKN